MPPICSFDIRDRIGAGWAWEWFNGPPWENRNELFFLYKAAGFRHMRAGIWPDSDISSIDGKKLTSFWVMREDHPIKLHTWLNSLAENDVNFLWGLRNPFPASQPYDPWFGAMEDVIDTIKRRYVDVTVGAEAPNEYDLAAPNPGHSSGWVPPEDWKVALKRFIDHAGFIWKWTPELSGKPFVGPSLALDASAAALGDLSYVTDAKNAHPYPGNTVYTSAQVDFERSDMESVNPGQPLWATEFGVRSSPPPAPGNWPSVDERQQAVILVKQYLTHLLKGVERSYLYKFFDTQESFGMVRNDLTLRPSYYAFKNLIALTDPTRQATAPASLNYTITGGDAATKSLVARNADGSALVFIWREKPLGTAPITVQLAVPGKTWKTSYDLISGVECPDALPGGPFDIVLGDDPFVVRV